MILSTVFAAGILLSSAHAITEHDYLRIETDYQIMPYLRVLNDDYTTVRHESNTKHDGRGIPMVTAYKFDTMMVCETMVLNGVPAPVGCVNYKDLDPAAKTRFDEIHAISKKYMACVHKQKDNPGACTLNNEAKPKK